MTIQDLKKLLPGTKSASENALSKTSPEDSPQVPQLPDDALIIVPVRATVLFPQVVMPLVIGRKLSIEALQQAIRLEKPIGLLMQRDNNDIDPKPDDLYPTGTVAEILRYIAIPDGTHHVACQGTQRFRVKAFIPDYPFLAAHVELYEEPEVSSRDIDARVITVKEKAIEVLNLTRQSAIEVVNAIQSMANPSLLADLIASYLIEKAEEKQEILALFDIQQRFDKILELLNYRIEVLKLSNQINEQTQESMGQKQREFMLREQMRAIQKELGEGEENTAEIEEISKAITAANMPEEAEKQARKELSRLQHMSDASGEYSMVRTYLDWLTELPWSKASPGVIDIAKARDILNADHYGLDKIKQRILEFLAVRKLNPNGKSPILCFTGPPGVGKTSLGRSIARASGREFVRTSLGGVHDEAEIRGHRRTYIGALPGTIIQSIRKAGTNNPVFMLDEMDKLGSGIQGDPSSALLEVLDPEQNSTFRDNYLGVAFDLSHVMFIGTANVLDNIPIPLRDRMEVIELTGYTLDEKAQIARRYLVGRQLETNGLTAKQCSISDAAIETIIQDYTREAGCRNLEREIGTIFRRVAMRIAEGLVLTESIETEHISAILGPKKYDSEVAMRTSVPGVATGLAWTPVGGDILFIEATKVPGSGKLILTGQLGDVMKESAQAALSLVKAHATTLNLNPDIFEKNDIHVHVPAGAIPKDGPSAGVAMFTALYSALSDRIVQSDIAMTGEISLRGLVLPVGGIKEKVIAAARAGIKTVMLPARNQRDFEEIPEAVRNQLNFVWLEKVDDALKSIES
ncbi:MAG: endopeptidase La [Methylicorpusculum sp.]|uniref:endopeptidase La n=1 Tax=Methylicorpusculum sp. TaxID=2713644 RepID=UPI002716A791|nr:endopeptidase La [Methylicorpusculum sp.]MDO8938654.1 endopeptidase La [Methylicorpusculum sp.]MDP2179247.1 endopeptidase La [Methylicorpusculum sp.]MDP2200441.1 endopeptidase La [Methylicorpusculum sp.]MDP3530029.1 endopeptidase La [Methylicorpusculum sp.]MDZ4152919.1 endopeptidase La [Methylicorpusculum sp.]